MFKKAFFAVLFVVGMFVGSMFLARSTGTVSANLAPQANRFGQVLQADDVATVVTTEAPTATPSYKRVLNPWDQQEQWLKAQEYNEYGFLSGCTKRGCFIIQNYMDSSTDVWTYAFWAAEKTYLPNMDGSGAIEQIVPVGGEMLRQDFFAKYGYILYGSPEDFKEVDMVFRPKNMLGQPIPTEVPTEAVTTTPEP